MTDKEKIHQILSSLWKNDDSVGKTYYNQALQDVQTAIDLQEESVIQNVITEPVGVPTGAVELANIPDKKSPTNEEIGDYDHKAVMKSLHPQLKEKAGWLKELEAKLNTLSKEELQRLMQKYEEKCNFKEEPVSEELEKVVEEIVDPTVLNAYGTKELARRLRNTICSTSVSEDLGEYINELSKQFPEVSFAKLSRIAVRVSRWQRNQDVKNKLPKVINRTELDEYAYQCAYDMSNDWAIENPTWHDVEDACKLGANWQKQKNESKVLTEEQCRKIRDDAFELGKDAMKQQMMKEAVDGLVVCDELTHGYKDIAMHIPDSLEVGDKVKVIVIKED